MGKIIAIACHKGGVGKTTTAAALGGILAAKRRRVLLVDLDAQKNLSTTFLEEPYERTTAEAFAQRRDLPEVPVRKNLFLAPASDDLCNLDAALGGAKASLGKERILADLVADIRDRYDFIIVDSPAQLGLATANALVAADMVLIPINADAYSMGGLGQIMELVSSAKAYYNSGLDVLGVFLTRYNGRRIVDRKVRCSLAEEYGDLALKTAIRENSAIVQAPLCRMDITAYEADSNGAKDYAALCDEILTIIKKRRK